MCVWSVVGTGVWSVVASGVWSVVGVGLCVVCDEYWSVCGLW